MVADGCSRCRFVFPPEVLKKISSRITNEVAGINRVTYDISSKPPAVSVYYMTTVLKSDLFIFTQTIEWL